MEVKNKNSKKGSAYVQPDYIKPKSKWTKKTTIWVIVIAVIVLGILAIVGGNNGWFKTKDMIEGKIELGDYSSIDIQESDIKVADTSVESFLNTIISYETTTETVTEGTVEDGDTINLDYSGVLAGEEEPFDGGTAQGQSLTLGSGTMIDGFESQIAGHEIGETFDINVTFPEDYSENLAGKDAVFTITINSKTVKNVPEMSDELVQKYSSEYMDEEYDTVDAIKEYYIDRTYNNNLETAIMNSLMEKADVKYYNEANLASVSEYNASYLSYYASAFGVDTATMASMYGYDTAAEYAEATAKDTLKQTMILDKIAEEQNITYTDEDFNEVIQKYMDMEGYTGTMEEFLDGASEGALYVIRETEVLKPKVMEYLKANVNIIESPEEETEAETEAAEAEAETEAAEAEAETEAAEKETETEAAETEAGTEAETEEKAD